ncbi:MAG: MFS transporter [Chloroflexota bacterium]
MLKSTSVSETQIGDAQTQDRGAWVHRFPFYYGWIILFSAGFTMIMTSPGQTFGVSIFIERFITELGISRSWVSTYYAIGTLTGSLTLTFIGRQIDRRGPRMMVVIIAVLFGLACIYMSSVQNWIMLLVGFTLLRMLGQGGLSLVSSNVINQWWIRRRGTVLGISGVFTALAGMGAAPNVLNWLVITYGWRTSYIIMGVVLVVLVAPFGYLMYRNKPEHHGLLPDGDGKVAGADGVAADGTTQTVEVEENWTLQEALHTSVYWVFTIGLASMASLGTGLTFHIVSIFEDSGLPAELAALVFVPVAITMAVTNLFAGALVDGVDVPIGTDANGERRSIRLQIRLRTLNAIGLVLHAVSLWMVPYLDITGLSVMFGLLLGLTFGLMRTVSMVAWARYFGRQNLGAIAGLTSTIVAGSSALGPMVMGIARDQLGSYNSTLNILAFLPLIFGIACLFVDRPTKAK